MAEQIEITAKFMSERFRFANPDGDVIIGTAHANGQINGPITIKGPATCGDGELCRGQSYIFCGHWTTYRNKRSGQDERQLAFQSFVQQAPSNREGIIAYLLQVGEGLVFGPKRAARLWDTFGGGAVDVLRDDPDRAREALTKHKLPMTEANVAKLQKRLQDKQAMEKATIELASLFANRGFRKSLPAWCLAKFNNRAGRAIKHDPYKLLPAPGCGWTNVDNLYRSLGLPLGRLKRQALAALNAIQTGGNGSVWFPRSLVESTIRSQIGGAEPKTGKAIELLLRANLLREIRTRGKDGPIATDGDFVWLAEAAHADAEERLAGHVNRIMAEPYEWPDIDTISGIDREQPDVLRLALRGALAILGGRPGAGKTFTTACLIKALIPIHGEWAIGIGAPTNLAAQRLTQAMAENGVRVRARTNHSLLGMPTVEQVRRGEKWKHNANNPFPHKVLVIDEGSMPDAEIMEAIFAALAAGTLVLLVGDINQLLPVSSGAPLRDLIGAGLPYGELKEIRRNSGGIVEACGHIADGEPWEEGDNLGIVEVEDIEQQKQAVLMQLSACKDAGHDPIWDTRVIVARNASRQMYNKLLQAALNKNPHIPGSPFRVGDKIIHRENANYKLLDGDYWTNDDANDGDDLTSGGEIRIPKGDLGRVVEVESNALIVELSAPRRVIRVNRTPIKEGAEDKGTGCAWDLAYAITYHSSQGSEFPWAILVASAADARMGCRELVYTGISRAKSQCKLIGKKSVYDSMCRRVALNERKTLLKERILLEQANRELAGL